MSRVEDFLSAEDEQEIVEAILKAEKNTSGEIRVHIESHTRLDHYERAREVFHLLKMDNTKEENGVLLYVAVNDKKFSICGDTGIDKQYQRISGKGPKNSFNFILKKETLKTVSSKEFLRQEQS